VCVMIRSKFPPLRLALLLAAAIPVQASAAELSVETVNAAKFDPNLAELEGQNPLVLKAQILLDRANASPGVIDGVYGENVAKAITAFETVHGLEPDGQIDEKVWSELGGDNAADVLTEHQLTDEDLDYDFVEEIPSDYAEMAKLDHLGFTSPEEMLAERFHMDIDLFKQLNPGADLKAGTTIVVANTDAPGAEGKVARIEADKGNAQIRAFDAEGKLIAAYPATIGSEENPSPSGTHKVNAVAAEPVYYYRPDTNFQQGENTEPLDIAAGPNNPVGSTWIDLSEPTYGIHGTPEPEKIDKTGSHGCIRLTNWDVQELAELVEKGTVVEFIE
jgi:lipoprotein-anchoring transpeptidase ErfK/SrfK